MLRVLFLDIINRTINSNGPIEVYKSLFILCLFIIVFALLLNENSD